MARECWRVYICPECDELYVYPGVCDNRDAHEDHSKFVITVATTVKAIDVSQDPLPSVQQPEGVHPEGAGGTE